jgi:two-component system chemotaxis response regulator CheB
MSEKIRVLVVDDSALMRKLIPQVLQRDPSIEVVGTAMDGEVGLRKLDDLRPHVVTLDLDMPRMDGLEMLRQITRKHRVPVILVSAQTERGASVTLKALALGAFDFVTKPPEAASGRLDQIAAELALKIKVAAGSGAPKMIITDFHGRSERASILIFAAAAGFSGMRSGSAAHAGGIYGNVCAAAG